MPKILRLVPLLSLLSTCVAPAGSCDLLPLPRYQDAEERQLANELDAAPPGAVWPWRLVDYSKLRAGVAACRKETL
ncbi:hypothetical protein VZ95_11250 [Elstera litoralis]|uniref:Uncharacterized protein n=1 Tax=Elstera litoralis TaxID=552518 RepID=A0A0F3IRV9_9PROT|nr:hypothetical protein [Elstera litoralis]KJV09485.1 hypothetical protein VZ95_11250 [Elstera litoralis]